MVTERNRGLDLVRWVALITIVIDHLRLVWAKIATENVGVDYGLTHVIADAKLTHLPIWRCPIRI